MYLLNSSNMSGNVFNSDGVLHGQTVALTFYPGFVDQNASIGGKSW